MSAAKEKQVLCLSDCESEAVEWLWPGRIAAGKLVLIDGDPDQGKSLLTLDLAARLTTARPLPDGPALQEPLAVVLVGTEDGVRDTIRPRLRAAGADLSRVHVFVVRSPDGGGKCPPHFPDDCGLLRETLHETGARLAIIDPLAAVLGRAAGGINGPLVRNALGTLAGLAEETRAAIVMVRHLTKGGRGQRALYRGTGAIDIIGVARNAFLVAPHPEDDGMRVFASTKNNLAVPPAALGFRICAGDQGQPVLSWTGAVDVTAEELVLEPARPRGQAVREARDFLADLLRRGPCRSEQVYQQADAAGIAKRTLQRAKAELNVVSEAQIAGADKHYMWRLRKVPNAEDSLPWPEQQKLALARAQKASDEMMERIRQKFGKKQ